MRKRAALLGLFMGLLVTPAPAAADVPTCSKTKMTLEVYLICGYVQDGFAAVKSNDGFDAARKSRHAQDALNRFSPEKREKIQKWQKIISKLSNLATELRAQGYTTPPVQIANDEGN